MMHSQQRAGPANPSTKSSSGSLDVPCVPGGSSGQMYRWITLSRQVRFDAPMTFQASSPGSFASLTAYAYYARPVTKE